MSRVAVIAAALAALTLGALTLGGASASAQERIRLAPAGSPAFPERSFRLSVPERRGLSSEDLKVSENGDPVAKLSLTGAAGGQAGEFGAVLLIDHSLSMRGPAIRGALEAARELARLRTGSQQLGIVTFHGAPTVLLEPTADQAAIDEVLARPPKLGRGTRIFDAVDTALALLDQAGIAAGSVIVLSDGADSGSKAPPAAVAQRARKENVRIDTVGLRSPSFDGGSLKRLATASGGRYTAAASPAELRRTFRNLGVQLAGDHLVRYRSSARPGSEVTVVARVAGLDGLAQSTYRVPGGATAVRVNRGFWTSGLGVAVTGLASALLLALALGILLVRRGRGPVLRERVRGFVSGPIAPSPAEGLLLTGQGPGATERRLERTRWWAGFKADVAIARITADPVRIVTTTALATLIVILLLVQVTGIPLVGLFALAIPLGVRTWVRLKRDRQRTLFVEQLPDMLQGAASAIRAGHGLVGALSLVAEDAPEPSRGEFLRVVADEGLGVPLEVALGVVQERMGSREVLQIALVAQIQREAGGNMAEVLDRITETVRRSAELRRMVKALTAQGRLSRWVVTAVPLVLLLLLSILNPTYVEPLFTEPLGLFLLALAGAMVAAGSVAIGKIVDFKV